ncbi:type I-E CRISPR-associated protein Cse2/CasB [Bifidobacterium canis]|uniref:Type I-E CRISPR-associated protein Cse2/CasB n=1 Tax=Bifidobacterium canis TaxID=2610880 RepID=A0A7K1J7W1_9BIFI|nr:type I-E CRISPR-associated protein Cse2/CasB [Bifidobacterium canis]
MSQTTPEQEYKLTPFGEWVSKKVRTLVNGHDGRSDGYLDDNAKAVADIARLAHAAGHEVGADPAIIPLTVPQMDDTEIYPHGVGSFSGPTDEERAAHAAITLFAVHQQSQRNQPMHVDAYVSLGRATGAMAYGNFNEKGIRSTFDKMQTASSWAEMIRHARRLIALLKREDQPLNYGLFAQDLMRLRQGRTAANAVRLRWGRDFQSAYMNEKNKSDNSKQSQK